MNCFPHDVTTAFGTDQEEQDETITTATLYSGVELNQNPFSLKTKKQAKKNMRYEKVRAYVISCLSPLSLFLAYSLCLASPGGQRPSETTPLSIKKQSRRAGETKREWNKERERTTCKQERKVKVNRSTFFCLFPLHIFMYLFFFYFLPFSLSLSVSIFSNLPCCAFPVSSGFVSSTSILNTRWQEYYTLNTPWSLNTVQKG